MGDAGQSCTEACSEQGLSYSDLTKTVAGSIDGTQSNSAYYACRDILTTMAVPPSQYCNGSLTSYQVLFGAWGAGGLGCVFHDADAVNNICSFGGSYTSKQWILVYDFVTNANASYYRFNRVCACE